MRQKLKPKKVYGVKPKNENWLYIPELQPTLKDARTFKRQYCNPDEMEIIEVIIKEIKVTR